MHNQPTIVTFTQITLLICLLSTTALVQAKVLETSQNQAIQNDQPSQQILIDQTPDGLSVPEWTSIQQQISAGKYRAYPNQTGGYSSSNPAHGWQIRYTTDGTTTLTPRNTQIPTYHLGMTLRAIGYQTLQPLDHPQQISAVDTTVIYQWNDNIKEWWINSPTRLEQWFSLEQRPAEATHGQPLTLQMTLDSELQVSQLGNSLHFTHAMGTTITYDKLKVWDATGQTLPARMQLTNKILSLIIDDSTAHYPLVIDPSFQQQAYLKASNTKAGDRFGNSVAISGDTLVIGALGETSSATGIDGDQSDQSANFSGAAYVFTRSGSTWSQQAYLKASNTGASDLFGISVAIAGDTVVVGAYGEESNATGVNGIQSDNSADFAGAAYVFTRSGGTWSQQAYLKSSNTEANDQFGFSVATTGNTVVIGAVIEDSNATGVNGDQNDNSASAAGAAYVFTRSNNTWSQQAYLKASNTETNDQVGYSVAIAGDTVVIGANAESSNTTEVNGDQSDNSADFAGAAYVFTRSGNIWSQQAYLKASNTEANDQFGISVAIAGNTVVVGAFDEDSNTTGVDGDQSDNSASAAGAAYVFTRSGSTWSQQDYLKASNTEANDNFGISVAIANDTVIVGANGEDSNATGVDGDQSDNSASTAGAAYIFTRSGGTWSQQTSLKASNTEVNDNFGISVAITDGTMVIGALDEASSATGVNNDQTNNAASNAGAAYVFNLSASSGECTLDADENANADALTDGLLFIRYLFGIRGDSLILDAVAADCANCSAAELESILEQCGTAGTSDIDGNGEVDALTDGLLIIRYLFGIRGDALTEGAVAADCSRCSVFEIETYLQGLLP
ncbi:MAG: FG-GAP repeat protein [Methylococcales bacterium]